MVRGALAIVTFLAGLIAGGVVVATATNAPAATAVPPTPSPAFYRYNAVDVVRAFNVAGLRADAPIPTHDPILVGDRVAAYDFLPYADGGNILLGDIVVTGSTDEQYTFLTDLAGRNRSGYFSYTWLIRHNVVVVFAYFSKSGPPDFSQYWATLMGMP